MAYKFPYVGGEKKLPSCVAPATVFVEKKPKPKEKRPLDIPLCSEKLRKILFEVCEKYKVHPNDVVGPKRGKKLVKVRQEFVWRSRTETQASFPRIGRALNRDHSTAVYHYGFVEAQKHAATHPAAKIRVKLDPPNKTQTELSAGQRVIRGLILRGYNNAEIGIEFGLSTTTIKKHKAIIKKLAPIPEEVEIK